MKIKLETSRTAWTDSGPTSQVAGQEIEVSATEAARVVAAGQAALVGKPTKEYTEAVEALNAPEPEPELEPTLE